MKDLYVVNCCRTAVGSFGGSLKDVPATDLGAAVVKEALIRANVKPEQVDEVMFGCILTAAQGQNPARQVAIKAGVPFNVPAYTVGMVCGSGMKSVIEAGRAIRSGDAEIVVCGGTENMSAAPYALPNERWGARMGDKKVVGQGVGSGAHVLGAAADHDIGVAGADGAGGLDDGLQAGAAHHAHGVGGDRVGQTGLYAHLTGGVLTLSGGQDAAEHQLVHLVGLQARPVEGFLHHDGAQVGRGGVGQGALKRADCGTAAADDV